MMEDVGEDLKLKVGYLIRFGNACLALRRCYKTLCVITHSIMFIKSYEPVTQWALRILVSKHLQEGANYDIYIEIG